MKDFKGNLLNIGDSVIYVHYSSSSSQYLESGIVGEIKKVVGRNVAYILLPGEKTVPSYRKGVTSQNIYKV